MKNKFFLYQFSENNSESKSGYTNFLIIVISLIAIMILIGFSN